MTKYVKNHTKYILEQMKANNITLDLLTFHQTQISRIQHERLIHLIVLCLFTLLLIGSIGLFFWLNTFMSLCLLVLFLVVEVFYILHYYLLENTVQRWYRLENDMTSQLKNIGTNISGQ